MIMVRVFLPGKLNNQLFTIISIDAINDDLNVSEGLAILWDALKDGELEAGEKLGLVYDFDKVFGLKLNEVKPEESEIPEEIMQYAEQRLQAKKAKNFAMADELREKIKAMGYEVTDKKEGYELKKI